MGHCLARASGHTRHFREAWHSTLLLPITSSYERIGPMDLTTTAAPDRLGGSLLLPEEQRTVVWWVVGRRGHSACFTWWSRGGFPQKGYCLPTSTCVYDKAGSEVKKRMGRGDYHTPFARRCAGAPDSSLTPREPEVVTWTPGSKASTGVAHR